MIALLLCLAFPAFAEGPEAWASLHDGRLSQSMDRGPSAAIAIYETLLSGMPDGDPMRGEVLYWLGRARLASGDSAGAMETLGSAKSVWSSRSRARALLGRLMAQKQAVRQLPYLQDFTRDSTPWVRGWHRGRDVDLVTKEGPGPGGRVASWRIEVRDGEEDFLTFSVDTDGAPISRIQLSLQATEFPAVVQLALEDGEGGRFVAPQVNVQTGSWTLVTLPLDRFVNVDQPDGGVIPNGARVRRVSLREITAHHAEDRGENHLLIDDMSLR